MVLFRIEHRGSKWVVLPESGDRVLGTHDTKEDAERQLAAIEASKARAHEVIFEAARGSDGKVRAGVWDRVCVPGKDEKDGQSTEFSLETLSQMVDNFVDRGDPIPIDFNHQSNYAHINGQPAPALGFYGALAIVAGGKVVKAGAARGVDLLGDSGRGLDLSRDGLWALRTEVTELGDELLPNFKLLSPTFMTDGTKRDGTPVGYSLAAVAATNTPWQSGTEITFNKQLNAGSSGSTDHKETQMAKLAKLAKFAGVGDDADDTAIKQALAVKMESEAKAAMGDEMYDYEGEAGKFEEAAKAYEDVHMDADGDDDGDEPHVALRKMAAKFRKLGKMASPAEGGEGTQMAKLEGDEKDKAEAKMATMSASLEATRARLAKLEAEEATRAKAIEAERERTFESLADQAIAGGYPKEARGALVKFARTDLDGARASVGHFLPKTGAPAHLFDRLSSQGAPASDARSARTFSGPAKPRVIKSPMGNFVEDDQDFAETIRITAESADPAVKGKVDALLHAKERPIMFNRLLAAEKVVRLEQPELTPEDE